MSSNDKNNSNDNNSYDSRSKRPSPKQRGQPTDPPVRRPRRSITSFTMEDICHLRNLVGAGEDDPTVMALIYVHGSWNNVTQRNTSNNDNTCLPKHCAVDRFALMEGLLSNIDITTTSTTTSTSSFDMWNVIGALQVDQSDDTYACVIGDDNYTNSHSLEDLPLPPTQLPVLAIAMQSSRQRHSRVRYLVDIPPSQLLWYSVLQRNPKVQQDPQATTRVLSQWTRIIQTSMQSLLVSLDNNHHDSHPWDLDHPVNVKTQQPQPRPAQQQALRIFVAGDRSSVGKSSVCLGLLGSLLHHYKYPASSLAYIKPATQCEAKQLVHTFCETNGIACPTMPGPLVYYKGFTRAYLKGETLSSAELLQECAQAVDDICTDKQVVVMDGVGFPAVGSICGTDNAAVLKACGYIQVPTTSTATTTTTTTTINRSPMGVVIVGGSGVGAAVDSYNLNATYFRQANIPIMGGIFNKLSTEEKDFYSLEKCKQQVTAYFEHHHCKQHGNDEKPFGFVPNFPGIAVVADDTNNEIAMTHVEEFLQIFTNHVNVPAILQRAQQIQQGVGQSKTTVDTVEMEDYTVTITTTAIQKKRKLNNNNEKQQQQQQQQQQQKDTGSTSTNKRRRLDHEKNDTPKKKNHQDGTSTPKTPLLTRDQIEQMAKQAGATGSA
jgi:AAA domain